MKMKKNLDYSEELWCLLTGEKCIENENCWKYKQSNGQCSNQFKRTFLIPNQKEGEIK